MSRKVRVCLGYDLDVCEVGKRKGKRQGEVTDEAYTKKKFTYRTATRLRQPAMDQS